MKEITKRGFLKLAAGTLSGAALAFGFGSSQDVLAQTPDNSQALENLLKRYAPFPWKQDIIRRNARARDRLTNKIEALGSTENVISTLGEWAVGPAPNYSAAVLRNGKKYAWVGCFGGEEVTQVNITDGVVTKFDAGRGTNPIDVAYDSKKDRIVAASADPEAKIIIFDKDGNRIKTLALAPLTGQGLSDGGAQGITVDADGNYWVAIAYHHRTEGIGKGVVAKVDPNTFNVSFFRHEKLTNPNGIVTSEDGRRIFSFSTETSGAPSDMGHVHEFDQNGNVVRVEGTLDGGYRGIVKRNFLFVAGWLPEGKVVRFDLSKNWERREYQAAPFGNSVQLDSNGLLFVAGDLGVSVGTLGGRLLELKSFGGGTNGLSVIGDDVFFVTYNDKLKHVRAEDRVYQPVSLSNGWNLIGLPPRDDLNSYTAETLLDEFSAQGITSNHIARWEGGRWQSFIPRFPVNNFSIDLGKGYFVKTPNGGLWRPGAKTP